MALDNKHKAALAKAGAPPHAEPDGDEGEHPTEPSDDDGDEIDEGDDDLGDEDIDDEDGAKEPPGDPDDDAIVSYVAKGIEKGIVPQKLKALIKGHPGGDKAPEWAADPELWGRAAAAVKPEGDGKDEFDDPWLVMAATYRMLGGEIKPNTKIPETEDDGAEDDAPPPEGEDDGGEPAEKPPAHGAPPHGAPPFGGKKK